VQLTFDPTNPRDVEMVLRLLDQGHTGKSDSDGVSSLSPADGEEEMGRNGSDPISSDNTPSPDLDGLADALEAIATDAPKKRGRKPKAQVEAAPVDDTPDPYPVDEVVETVTLSLDDARVALKGYTERHGMARAIALLNEYGCQRVSELKADQFGEFIQDCKARKE